jgi:hypothetical protein
MFKSLLLFAFCLSSAFALSSLCDTQWFADDTAFRDNGNWEQSEPSVPFSPNNIYTQTPTGGRPFFKFNTTFTNVNFLTITDDQDVEFATSIKDWAGASGPWGVQSGRTIDCDEDDEEDCPQRVIYNPYYYIYPFTPYEKSCTVYCANITSDDAQIAFRTIPNSYCPDQGGESFMDYRNVTYAMWIKDTGSDIEFTWVGQEDPINRITGNYKFTASSISGLFPIIFQKRLEGREDLYN